MVLLPSTVAAFVGVREDWIGNVASNLASWFNPTHFFYWGMSFFLVVMFTFFYTPGCFPAAVSRENLQRNGGFVPGIRPGRPTQDYLTV